ncbi:MAG TPA: FAD-dependent oxidoreductase [Bryobacteraceae bacterium]|nr:FAD-dependent oxidoreductase [Bryobacteraceae bacterium]
MPDCAIVGGGIIGCTIAWRLVQQGLKVVLFEAGNLGGEASTAGAGMLAPGGEVAGDSELARLLVASLRRYGSFVEELVLESACSVDFRRCGAVEVVRTGEELAALSTRSESQRVLGIPSEPLPLSDLPAAVARDVAGARFYPDDGLVDPVDLMRALRQVLTRLDVDLREGCRVDRILPQRNSFRVNDVEAGSVVIAAGAWSSAIEIPSVRLPRAYPVKGHLLGFELPPGSLGPLVRYGHTYVLQRSSGFTVAGASTEDAGFDKHVDETIAAEIRAEADAILPGLLAGAHRTSVWTGLRPGTDSAAPLIRRWNDSNLWLAYGHYRNGILAAPETAERIAAGIFTSSLEKD